MSNADHARDYTRRVARATWRRTLHLWRNRRRPSSRIRDDAVAMELMALSFFIREKPVPRLSNHLPNVAIGLVVVFLISACGGGGSSNKAPVAAGDIVQAAGADLGRIDVLANDSDPEGDPLTVAIEESANVGTASVNADGTVGISGLPSGFKGLTQFKYRVSDPDGASAVGT